MARSKAPIERQEEVLRLYAEGKSVRAIKDGLRMGDSTIRRIITEVHGHVEVRYATGARNKASGARDYSGVVADYKAGMGVVKIAKKHGIAPTTVCSIARVNGCKQRAPRPENHELAEAVRKGLRPGQTWTEFAEEHYVSITTVARMRKFVRLEGDGDE